MSSKILQGAYANSLPGRNGGGVILTSVNITGLHFVGRRLGSVFSVTGT